jgi:Domain of unknown function (DUF4376)
MQLRSSASPPPAPTYFNPLDWFWLADDKRVYGSAKQTQVTDTDPDYTAWVNSGGVATPWPRDLQGNQTDAALQDTVGPHGRFVNLTYYAADARWRRQTGGITVAGVAYRTDRVSSNERNNAYNYGQANPGATFKWKLPDGTFVTLDQTALTHVTMSESAFVQNCFTCENDTVASITGGTITDKAGVDAAFAAVSNVFA